VEITDKLFGGGGEALAPELLENDSEVDDGAVVETAGGVRYGLLTGQDGPRTLRQGSGW